MYGYSTASTKCTRLTCWKLNINKPVSTTPEGCGYSLTGVRSQLRANQRVTHTDFTPWEQHKYSTGEPIQRVSLRRGQLFQLARLVKGWLGLAQSVAEVLETIAIDKCLRELPTSLLRTVSQSDPQCMDNLVKAIDACGATKALVNAGRQERTARRPPATEGKDRGGETVAETNHKECSSRLPRTDRVL